MSKRAKSRPPKKAKHITARSIMLEDAKGKPRIFMNAGDGEGYASICIFGEGGRSVQISSQPNGAVIIALHGRKSQASLVMAENEMCGIDLRDQEGFLGTLLGANGITGEHELAIFKNGQHHWSTRAPKKKRPRAKKKKSTGK